MDKSKQSSTNEARDLARASAGAAANEAEDAVEARAEIIKAVNEMEKQATTDGAAPGTAQPAPKKKTGKIVAIVILAVLLLGGIGGVAWFLAFYNQPEKLALDAIVGALNAENVSEESVVAIASDDSYSTLSVNSVSSRSGATQLDVTFDGSSFSEYDLEPISISLQLQQDRLFVQTSGVDDYLTLVLYALMGGYSVDYDTEDYDTDELLEEEIVVENEDLTDESAAEEDSTDEVYDYYELDEDMMVDSDGVAVDGTWWMVDLSEASEYLGADAEAVTCLVQSLTTGEMSDDLAKAYLEHPFLTATNYDSDQALTVSETGQTLSAEFGQQLIKVAFDETAMIEFFYDYYNNSLAGTVASCAGAELEQMSMNDVQEVVEEVMGEEPSIIVLKVSTFGHQLLGAYSKIEIASSDDLYSGSSTVTMIAEMSYPAAVDTAEPTEYEDVLDTLKSMGVGSDDLEALEKTYLLGESEEA